jgi:hypothetical protein
MLFINEIRYIAYQRLVYLPLDRVFGIVGYTFSGYH